MTQIDLGGLFPGASSGLLDILKQLQGAQNEANTANEKRYQDVLQQYEGMGIAGMTRIGQAEQQAQAKGTQDLTSRGLGNTTITSATNRGIASDSETARQQLQENVATQKAGVMERKNESFDMTPYLSLLQGAAKNQPRAKTTVTNIDWGSWNSPGFGSAANPNSW